MKAYEIETLFCRWQEEALTQNEREWLDAQLQSQEFREHWDALKTTWEHSGTLAVPQGTPADAQWQRLQQRITEAEKAIPAKPARHRDFQWSKFWQPRPVIAFAFSMAIIIFAIFQMQKQHSGAHLFTTHSAEQKAFELPDGSMIELNAQSSVQLAETFNQTNREITLSGEAFFQVQKSDKPFIIQTTDARITVTGTSFNIRTFDEHTRVAVKTGHVRVAGLNDEHEIHLSAGEMIRFDASHRKYDVKNIDENIFAWRSGDLVFYEMALAHVASELERRFAIKMHVDEPLRTMRISAHFKEESLHDILTFIAQATGSTLVKEGDIFWLRIK